MLNDSNIGIIANLTLVNHKSIGNSQENEQFVASTFCKTNDFNRMSSYSNGIWAWFLEAIDPTQKKMEDIYHDSWFERCLLTLDLNDVRV